MDIENNFSPYKQTKLKTSWGKVVLITLGVLVILASLGAAGYFYKKLSDIKKDPTLLNQNETQATLDEVGKLIVLPTDETPTVATVTDPTQLKDQTFFAHAEKGDKVLIYTTNKMAILYSPTLNKIVQVGPVSDAPASGTSPDSTTPPATPTNTTK